MAWLHQQASVKRVAIPGPGAMRVTCDRHAGPSDYSDTPDPSLVPRTGRAVERQVVGQPLRVVGVAGAGWRPGTYHLPLPLPEPSGAETRHPRPREAASSTGSSVPFRRSPATETTQRLTSSRSAPRKRASYNARAWHLASNRTRSIAVRFVDATVHAKARSGSRRHQRAARHASHLMAAPG